MRKNQTNKDGITKWHRNKLYLFYYCARYYDSSMGRFISQDPIEFEADVNFYRYVHNNPMRWVDPLGLDLLDWIPITSTVKNWSKYRRGTHIWDYHQFAGREDCEFRIATQMLAYIGNAIGGRMLNYGTDLFTAALGHALKKGGKHFLAGLVLPVVGWLDFGLSLYKNADTVFDIYQAAKDAQIVFCRC